MPQSNYPILVGFGQVNPGGQRLDDFEGHEMIGMRGTVTAHGGDTNLWRPS